MRIKNKHFEQIKELTNFYYINSSSDMQSNLDKIAKILQKVAEYNENKWFCVDKVTGERI